MVGFWLEPTPPGSRRSEVHRIHGRTSLMMTVSSKGGGFSAFDVSGGWYRSFFKYWSDNDGALWFFPPVPDRSILIKARPSSGDERIETVLSAGGGIGRRARLRIWWPQGRGGSIPPSRTISISCSGRRSASNFTKRFFLETNWQL